MLRQVKWIAHITKRPMLSLLGSYDLGLDSRLAEETTVLVESYTVSSSLRFIKGKVDELTGMLSFLMVG